MNKSESIGKLAEALAKAQGVIEGAHKSSSNPYFKSKYADLASVWDAIRKPLSDNGLAVIQTGVPNAEHDLISIETTLCHTSGEWVSGIISVKAAKTDPQSVISCVTYLRRASLSAIAGVSPEDDDAEAVTHGKEPQKALSKEKKAVVEDVPEETSENAEFAALPLGEKFEILTKLCEEKKYTPKKAVETYRPEEMTKFYAYLNKLEVK